MNADNMVTRRTRRNSLICAGRGLRIRDFQLQRLMHFLRTRLNSTKPRAHAWSQSEEEENTAVVSVSCGIIRNHPFTHLAPITETTKTSQRFLPVRPQLREIRSSSVPEHNQQFGKSCTCLFCGASQFSVRARKFPNPPLQLPEGQVASFPLRLGVAANSSVAAVERLTHWPPIDNNS